MQWQQCYSASIQDVSVTKASAISTTGKCGLSSAHWVQCLITRYPARQISYNFCAEFFVRCRLWQREMRDIDLVWATGSALEIFRHLVTKLGYMLPSVVQSMVPSSEMRSVGTAACTFHENCAFKPLLLLEAPEPICACRCERLVQDSSAIFDVATSRRNVIKHMLPSGASLHDKNLQLTRVQFAWDEECFDEEGYPRPNLQSFKRPSSSPPSRFFPPRVTLMKTPDL